MASNKEIFRKAASKIFRIQPETPRDIVVRALGSPEINQAISNPQSLQVSQNLDQVIGLERPNLVKRTNVVILFDTFHFPPRPRGPRTEKLPGTVKKSNNKN